MVECINAWCRGVVRNVAGLPTRTPGFYPDYECECGARWMDSADNWNKRKSLRDLYDAVKEYRCMSGDTDGHSVGVRTAGRREP